MESFPIILTLPVVCGSIMESLFAKHYRSNWEVAVLRRHGHSTLHGGRI